MVTLADVTRAGVLAAVEEFDRLDRDAFLRSTGFRRAQAYFLEYGGGLYDSKAIAGYAHGISTGTPLRSGDFTGGDKTVAHRLEALGFTVRYLPYADWTEDEIILACELVEANGWKQLDANDPRVQALSDLLQSPANHPFEPRHPDFRNAAGVARKTHNIASVHPDYRGAPTHTSGLDKEVLEAFRSDGPGMRAMAARIRELLSEGDPNAGALPDLDTDDAGTSEGGLALRAHLRRERDRTLRHRKIADTRRRGLPIACEVCAFDFGQEYGFHGVDYIECHHRTPLHVTGQTKTMLADLALLCSNCHRMIHRTKQWLTIEELKGIYEKYHQVVPGGQ